MMDEMAALACFCLQLVVMRLGSICEAEAFSFFFELPLPHGDRMNGVNGALLRLWRPLFEMVCFESVIRI
jgi:hypothetical protein